jgi:5S rRNA maturation endonuclease (ribonuclease M5)
VEKFLGLRSDELEFTFVESEVQHTAPTFNPLLGYPRDKVIKTLKIPCPFYSKKFDPKILTRYDIGLSDNPMQKFYWRTCVPIYDETNKSLVGITGRSNFEQCQSCKLYHEPDKRCPDPKYSVKYVKWRHSQGFKTAYQLFNFWREFPLIESKRRAILCESVGNALKLIQNNVRNVCATFGAKLSHDQAGLLNRAKVTKILVLFDNDDAGRRGAEKIVKDFGNFYDIKVLFPCPSNADLADLKDTYIQNYIFPEIRKVAKQ